MIMLTARFSRWKTLLFILAAALFAALILFLFFGLRNSGTEEIQLATNEDRIAYLQSWGWEVKEDPVETFQLLLPKPLAEPYVTYNELQKEQGFDLSKFCGKQVTRYTYALTNYPDQADGVQVNLYLCENVPVAGDVIASGENGFQSGLQFPDKK